MKNNRWQKSSLKIGARTSRLAQAMAHAVGDQFLNHNCCVASPQRINSTEKASIDYVSFVTKGDKIQDQALLNLGGKGLFTAEIEKALLEKRIDIAVHSAKDMPSFLPEGLKIVGYLGREDPRDGFISHSGRSFFDLPKHSVIGTAALRRQALIKKLRPDLEVTLLRGNVETRIEKVKSGVVDGTFLAMSGLKRLGLDSLVQDIFDLELFPPAPGQGAICLEIRADDLMLEDCLTPILNQETDVQLRCERKFLKTIDGSCRTPLACYARIEGDKIFGYAQIFSLDGQLTYEAKGCASFHEASQLGESLALDLKAQAGDPFFMKWYR